MNPRICLAFSNRQFFVYIRSVSDVRRVWVLCPNQAIFAVDCRTGETFPLDEDNDLCFQTEQDARHWLWVTSHRPLTV
jgi:hypothetical protein